MPSKALLARVFLADCCRSTRYSIRQTAYTITMTIYTIGHSTHPQQEFIDLLKSYDIEQLVDIRTVPKSRHNPQFWYDKMQQYLPKAGIEYIYMKELGGLRPKAKVSTNGAWRNASFRNYADYMQTDEFAAGVDRLVQRAATKRTVIMCAEAVPWRCHRSLVGDALLVRGINVCDIMSATSCKEHTLTSFAVTNGTTVTYPASE